MVDRRMRAALANVVLGVVLGGGIGCKRPAPATPAAAKVTLTVLPAESNAFPRVAEAATASLAEARVEGIDATQVSKVSLEVVQLSIECVEASDACYAAVGKTLSADRLLFAQIAKGRKRREVKVSVTLFDVVARAPRTTEKVYASERAATAGVAELVAEVTRP